jgi:hypothetical protein
MATVTLVSETAFDHPAEKIYDFVSNPANWVKTYPGSTHEEGLPAAEALKVGDTWTETGPSGDHYSWQVSMTNRPTLWVCETTGRLGHDGKGNGGHEGRIEIRYRFMRPGKDVTIFQRTYITETYPGAPALPDIFFTSQNPKHAEVYFAGIARELDKQG